IFIHGALTSIVAVGLWRGRRAGIGAYLLAVGLHAAANIGPILAQLGIIGGDIASLFLFPFVLLIAGIFERQRRAVRPAAAGRVDEIYVRRVCARDRTPALVLIRTWGGKRPDRRATSR